MTAFRSSNRLWVILAALFLTVLFFTGCGSAAAETKAFESTLSKDFSIGNVEWGSGYEQVKATIGKEAEELENGARLSRKGLTFFGQKADVDYLFGNVDGEMKLCAVSIRFEKDFDKEAVIEGVSSVLGEIDKYSVTGNGDRIPVDEPLWKWHDEEKVGLKYLHTAAFAEDLATGRPVLEFSYNGLWN